MNNKYPKVRNTECQNTKYLFNKYPLPTQSYQYERDYSKESKSVNGEKYMMYIFLIIYASVVISTFLVL